MKYWNKLDKNKLDSVKSLEVTLLNRLGDRGLGIVKDASLKQAKKKKRERLRCLKALHPICPLEMR